MMVQRGTTRTWLTAILACALLGVAACSATPADLDDPAARDVSYTEPPLPNKAENASAPTPPPAASTSDCGDPTVSLRPLADPSEPPGPNVDAIRARGRVVVGLDTSSNLFSFRDPISGAIEGFDVEIAKEIARDLFTDPERIEYRILGSADREAALQSDAVDIVVKTMTINCARRQKVDFSTVYYQANQRILAVKNSGIRGIEDLAGKRVCIVRGTTSLQHIQQMQPAASILTVPGWADCLVVLQQRQVDAVSTDDAILAGLAAQDPYLEVVGKSISPEPYGIGIGKGKEDLVRFVNATLDRIRADGTWNAIYNRWLAVLGPSPGPPQPKYED
ncbi:glutamate ABC transporter substrate-binding protein [Antrihabitans spumae]|uniref:Glutamate ABC transporter substrate-binding protein n=1 Tax=Antrihabitans spumae TaxID=3373370 RepID=A0ABW7KKZ3_9NOCA